MFPPLIHPTSPPSRFVVVWLHPVHLEFIKGGRRNPLSHQLDSLMFGCCRPSRIPDRPQQAPLDDFLFQTKITPSSNSCSRVESHQSSGFFRPDQQSAHPLAPFIPGILGGAGHVEDFRGKVLKTHSHNIYHFWRCCVPSKYPGSSWGILEATRAIIEAIIDTVTLKLPSICVLCSFRGIQRFAPQHRSLPSTWTDGFL